MKDSFGARSTLDVGGTAYEIFRLRSVRLVNGVGSTVQPRARRPPSRCATSRCR